MVVSFEVVDRCGRTVSTTSMLLARINAAAGHKAVDAGTHGDHAHIGRDEQVQVAETLVALEPLLTQPAVGIRDLDAVLKLVAGIVFVGMW